MLASVLQITPFTGVDVETRVNELKIAGCIIISKTQLNVKLISTQ
jgi:hypothetical protein